MNLYFLKTINDDEHCAVVCAPNLDRAIEMAKLPDPVGVTNLTYTKCEREHVMMSTTAIRHVRNCHDIQMSAGNGRDDPKTGYKADEYMRGMANGLELAMALLDHRDVQYIEPRKDNESHHNSDSQFVSAHPD